MHHRLQAGGESRVAEITMPSHTAGWVVVGLGPRERDRALLSEATAALNGASLATLAIDLPARAAAAGEWVRVAAESLRLDMAGGLPVAYLGAGVGAGAGWAASTAGELRGVMALNAAPRGSWSKLRRVQVPSLLVVQHGAHDFGRRLLVAKVLSWQLDAVQLEVTGAPLDAGLLARWYWDRVLSPAPLLAPARSRPSLTRRRVATIGAAAALAVPTAMPAASAMALPDFSHGSKLNAHHIHGDSHRHKAHDGHRGRQHAMRARAAGKRLRAAEVLGDGLVSPFATGSVPLVDGSGVKYFINTDITFSTSSSASGAMSRSELHACSIRDDAEWRSCAIDAERCLRRLQHAVHLAGQRRGKRAKRATRISLSTTRTAQLQPTARAVRSTSRSRRSETS